MDKDIYAVALRMLTSRNHSQTELAQKLHLKGHPSVEIPTVITRLKENGLLNDLQFAQHFIHYRKSKGYGPLRILKELESRGITNEIIAQELHITDNAWLVEVRKVWQKQFKNRLPTDFKARAKQMRFLQYRGFTIEQIKSVFSDQEYD